MTNRGRQPITLPAKLSARPTWYRHFARTHLASSENRPMIGGRPKRKIGKRSVAALILSRPYEWFAFEGDPELKNTKGAPFS